MNTNQLEYFISVAENLNFTKAAAQCYISQTAMTQQIRALEKTVGVPLFIRDKHHVELTTAGRIYLKEARAIVKRSNEALRLARTASEGIEGAIQIGYIRGYGQGELSGKLRRFHDAYPGVEMTFVRNNMSVLIDMVGKGMCDVAFAISMHKQQFEGLSHMHIGSFPVLAVVSDGHPLADRPYLTYPELEHEDFIMMQPTDRPKDQMEESMLIYERGGYLPNVVAIEGDPETLLLMISIGLGISILPEYIVESYPKKDIAILPMVKEDGSAETIDLEVYWREENENPALEQFLETL